MIAALSVATMIAVLSTSYWTAVRTSTETACPSSDQTTDSLISPTTGLPASVFEPPEQNKALPSPPRESALLTPVSSKPAVASAKMPATSPDSPKTPRTGSIVPRQIYAVRKDTLPDLMDPPITPPSLGSLGLEFGSVMNDGLPK